MLVRDQAATTAQPLHLGGDLTALAMLTFGADGRLRDFTAQRGPLHLETPAEEHAALLVQAIAAKYRRTPDLAELIRRARQALDLLERLAEMEAIHGPEAARAIAAKQGAA